MKNTFLITTLLATTALATSAWADTCTAKSGNCGTNCTYTIDTDCHLVVQGPTEEGQTGSIEAMKFYNNRNIVSAEIKGNITDIGHAAFLTANKLSSVILPNTVTTIGSQAFQETLLTSIVIPDSVTEIKNNAFSNAFSLTSLILPSSVTTVGQWAFSGIPNTAVIYCQQGGHGGKSCASLIEGRGFYGTIQAYSSSDGVYSLTKNGQTYYYSSADKMITGGIEEGCTTQQAYLHG